jgi:hypothetical protein
LTNILINTKDLETNKAIMQYIIICAQECVDVGNIIVGTKKIFDKINENLEEKNKG